MPDPISDLEAMQTTDAEQRLLNPRQAIAIDLPPDDEATANDVFFVMLDDRTLAVWKPLAGVEPITAAAYGHTPTDTAINEAAAWQVAKHLGEPFTELVPTAVWRELPNVRELLIEANPKRHPRPEDVYNDNYDRGVLIEYVPGHPNLEPFTTQFAVQASDAALFDALIGQQDRHTTNFRWDEGTQRLHLIDNGFAFPYANAPAADSVFLQWRSLNGRLGLNEMLPNIGARRIDERATLEHLQRSGALPQIAGLLREDRGACLLDRCQTMLDTGRLLPFGDFGQSRGEPNTTLPAQAREALDLTRMASPRPAREGLTGPPTQGRPSTASDPPNPHRRPQR
jgi:hypothetical protein